MEPRAEPCSNQVVGMSLFQPMDIGGTRLPNRIVLPAMVTRLSGEDGYVNEDIRDRYVRFAEGEPGLIVMEAMAVHSSRSGPLLRISDDCFVPGLADVVSRVHDTSGSRIVPQIIHFLKISRRGWRQTVDSGFLRWTWSKERTFGPSCGRATGLTWNSCGKHLANSLQACRHCTTTRSSIGI